MKTLLTFSKADNVSLIANQSKKNKDDHFAKPNFQFFYSRFPSFSSSSSCKIIFISVICVKSCKILKQNFKFSFYSSYVKIRNWNQQRFVRELFIVQISAKSLYKRLQWVYIYHHHSSSCNAASTDIPDPLSPLLPIIHRLRQVFRVTSCVLT